MDNGPLSWGEEPAPAEEKTQVPQNTMCTWAQQSDLEGGVGNQRKKTDSVPSIDCNSEKALHAMESSSYDPADGFLDWQEGSFTMEYAVRQSLNVLDDDGDGKVNAKLFDEFMQFARGIRRARESCKWSRRLLGMLALISLLLVISLTGIVWAVVALSKEVKVSNGMLVATNGTMVSTAQALVSSDKLSSGFDDNFFRNLRYIQATSPTGARLYMQVLGFIRLPAMGICGSIVVLSTSEGKVELDGETLSFQDRVDSTTFEKAGFMVNQTNRRLGGIVQLAVALNPISNWDYKCVPEKTLEPEFAGWPTSYYMKMNVHFPCSMTAAGGADESCLVAGGSYRPGFVERAGNTYIQVQQQLFVDYPRVYRLEVIYPHSPQFVEVQVRNCGLGLHLAYQVDRATDRNYFCQYTDTKRNLCKQGDEAEAHTCASNSSNSGNECLSQPTNVRYVGQAQIDGATYRQFETKDFAVSDHPQTIHLFFDDDQRPRIIKYPELGLLLTVIEYTVDTVLDDSMFTVPRCEVVPPRTSPPVPDIIYSSPFYAGDTSTRVDASQAPATTATADVSPMMDQSPIPANITNLTAHHGKMQPLSYWPGCNPFPKSIDVGDVLDAKLYFRSGEIAPCAGELMGAGSIPTPIPVIAVGITGNLYIEHSPAPRDDWFCQGCISVTLNVGFSIAGINLNVKLPALSLCIGTTWGVCEGRWTTIVFATLTIGGKFYGVTLQASATVYIAPFKWQDRHVRFEFKEKGAVSYWFASYSKTFTQSLPSGTDKWYHF